ncbi:Serine/threonine-protein kinase RIO1 [Halotydeus destructor]|nr:Serine/threonine-protein kinase RIO1 [Halotydeus destructor]
MADHQFSDAEEDTGTWVFTKLKDNVKDEPPSLEPEADDSYVEDEEQDSDVDEEYMCWENGKLRTYEAEYRDKESKPASLKKLESKLNVGKYEPMGYTLNNRTNNELNQVAKKLESDRVRVKDKCDRATVEQVLDPRTRMILLKMLNRNAIEEMNGCISTGKEANVYHAVTRTGFHKAIKIYKTSILTFKDRDKYVSGEFRFRHGYCRHNPRKMVRTWAEKEMRNLLRISQAGIRCPQPDMLRSHVLLMEFVGTKGMPAPLLKDVTLSESKARELYLDCIIMMRELYTKAKLVHADFSEFNILYHEGALVLIDVSQSVEHDHPRALDFLRSDCTNANSFFRKFDVPTLTLKELFDFITDPNITDDNLDDYLEEAQKIASRRTINDLNQREKQEEEIFRKLYIPKRLDEVADYEKDAEKVLNQGEKVIYQTITAMKPDLSGASTKPALLDSEGDSEDSNDSDEEETDGERRKKNCSNSARPRDESPNSRKCRKNAFKEAKKEKLKEKVPKHIKKRRDKVGKTSSKK